MKLTYMNFSFFSIIFDVDKLRVSERNLRWKKVLFLLIIPYVILGMRFGLTYVHIMGVSALISLFGYFTYVNPNLIPKIT